MLVCPKTSSCEPLVLESLEVGLAHGHLVRLRGEDDSQNSGPLVGTVGQPGHDISLSMSRWQVAEDVANRPQGG